MGSFIKPKTEFVSDREYIEKLLNANLRKDLHDNEEICSYCHGTGLVIVDNPYGLREDPDKRNLFPYNHQALTFCPRCYNGIIRRCGLCGEIIPKGCLKHNCEQQRELDRLVAEEKEKALLEAAAEFPPESINDFVYCYYEGYPDNGYFKEWDEFFDWWNECERTTKRPVYVWGTVKTEMSMDAAAIVKSACDELYEDAESNISQKDIQKLQTLLDNWCKNCGVGATYTYTTQCKVRIPWEDFEPETEGDQ